MKSWITLLLITQSIFGLSQVEIENQSLTDPSYKALCRLNDNKIVLIRTNKKRIYDLISSDSLSQITKVSNTEFIIRPSNGRKLDTLKIIENGIEIRAEYYHLFPMPLPIIQLGHIHYTENFTTIDRIKSDPTLRLVYDELYKRSDTIVGYDMKIYDANDSLLYTSENNTSASLTAAQIDRISEINPGERLEFSNIRCKEANGIIHVYSSFRLEIEK